MRKGYKKENGLDCTISIRISKEEKEMIDSLRSNYFNVSKYFRDLIGKMYRELKEAQK